MTEKKSIIAGIFAERLTRILSAKPHGAQKDLALACGLEPSYLNNVLSGRRDCSEDTRRIICKELGYKNYDHFLFGDIFGPGNHTVTRKEKEPVLVNEDLLEFVTLYRQYGSPAFLQSCTQRLLDIKGLIEK